MKIQTTPNRAAFDVQGAQDVRAQFQKDPQQGLKAAAQQFETMFLQMVMKSMRDTVPQEGMLDSDQTRLYNSLLDQQMAQNLSTSGKGVGFARLIEQQLGRQSAGSLGSDAADAAKAADSTLPLTTSMPTHMRHAPVIGSLPSSSAYASAAPTVSAEASTRGAGDAPATAKDFVGRVWPHAVEASRSTGIPPQFLIAHSALESGWGRSEPRMADGSPSYNLFGIKAGSNWTGKVVEATTTEYVNGEARQSVERFRAYGSYAEAYGDYAKLLRGNARYSSVIGVQDGTEFARGLQQAGYATDPSYADKLTKIINGPTLRQALIG